MSREIATVVSVENGVIRVTPERKSSCGSCSVQSGCGISVLSNVLGKKETAFEVMSQITVKKGDKVIISLKDNMLLLVSVVVYLLPLVLMIVGGLAGMLLNDLVLNEMLLSEFNMPQWLTAETASIIGIVCGLLAGLIFSRLFFNYQSQYSRFYPVIIGKALSHYEKL